MNPRDPQPEATASGSCHGRMLLLETAAGLIDKRVASIRCGIAPLHAVLELELAARAIRQLASELDRLQDSQPVGDERRGLPPGALRGPPVLTRISRPPAPAQDTPGQSTER